MICSLISKSINLSQLEIVHVKECKIVNSSAVVSCHLVSDFIVLDKARWKTELLHLHVNNSDLEYILSIPFRICRGEDFQVWHYITLLMLYIQVAKDLKYLAHVVKFLHQILLTSPYGDLYGNFAPFLRSNYFIWKA